MNLAEKKRPLISFLLLLPLLLSFGSIWAFGHALLLACSTKVALSSVLFRGVSPLWYKGELNEGKMGRDSRRQSSLLPPFFFRSLVHPPCSQLPTRELSSRTPSYACECLYFSAPIALMSSRRIHRLTSFPSLPPSSFSPSPARASVLLNSPSSSFKRPYWTRTCSTSFSRAT